MNVKIVIFPETKVAAIEHHGPPALECDGAKINRMETGELFDGSVDIPQLWTSLLGSAEYATF